MSVSGRVWRQGPRPFSEKPWWGFFCAHHSFGVGDVANSGRRLGSGAGTQGPTLPSSGAHSPGRRLLASHDLRRPWIPGKSVKGAEGRMSVDGPKESGKAPGAELGRRWASLCLNWPGSGQN